MATALSVNRLGCEAINDARRVLLREFSYEVDTVVWKTGRTAIATDPMGVEMSDVFVMLRPSDE